MHIHTFAAEMLSSLQHYMRNMDIGVHLRAYNNAYILIYLRYNADFFTWEFCIA